MGVKQLNRFLKDNCSKYSIAHQHLSLYKGKRMVIDTSIFMYKFITEKSLLEQMYNLISILRDNNIQPLFVFDGKPPPEKMEILRQRRETRWNAKQEFNQLHDKLHMLNTDKDETAIRNKMNALETKMVRIKDDDINKVKSLMDAYGVMYYDAKGESDDVCAFMVKNGIADVCLSDDMDMFLYGIPCIIRNISMLHHTAIGYDYNKILEELEMTDREFREIMILSGSDYGMEDHTSIHRTIEWFYKYRKHITDETCECTTFYDWLVANTEYVNDIDKLNKIYDLYELKNTSVFDELQNMEIKLKEPCMIKLKYILYDVGFIF